MPTFLTRLWVCPLLPGRGKQALDSCDEDEHDEGAHQVGLEDLVPHLGVLHREKGEGKEKGGRSRRRRWRKDGETGFQSENTPDTHTRADTSALPQVHASSTTSVRERQEPVG